MSKNKGVLDSSSLSGLRWSVGRRLCFIDFRLQWYGKINRSDLVDEFQISIPQASNDLKRYREAAPRNLRYNKSEKCYYASNKFEPRFGTDSSESYLSQLLSVSMGMRKLEDSFLAWRPPHDSVQIPDRKISTRVLKALLGSIHGQMAMRCRYQSMGRPDPSERVISPVALASNGLRWHVRAYCHEHEEFRDFVCSRIVNADIAGPSKINPLDDEAWYTFVNVRIGPDPRLSPSQRHAIEFDYEMEQGERQYSIRAALLFYFLKSLGLEERPADYPAKWQQIILLNREELIEDLGASALP